jgi:hypothetical protein
MEAICFFATFDLLHANRTGDRKLNMKENIKFNFFNHLNPLSYEGISIIKGTDAAICTEVAVERCKGRL